MSLQDKQMGMTYMVLYTDPNPYKFNGHILLWVDICLWNSSWAQIVKEGQKGQLRQCLKIWDYRLEDQREWNMLILKKGECEGETNYYKSRYLSMGIFLAKFAHPKHRHFQISLTKISKLVMSFIWDEALNQHQDCCQQMGYTCLKVGKGS